MFMVYILTPTSALGGRQGFNILDGNSSLYRLIHSSIDMPEGIVLWSQSFLYGSVIDSPKVTHVERNGVHAYIPGFQIGFIK